MSMGLCNSSVKFPNEKSRKAHSTAKFPNKKPGNFVSTDDKVPTESGQLKSNTFWGQPENKKDWVFYGSALSPEEKYLSSHLGIEGNVGGRSHYQRNNSV
ncbi:uncharacterized protein [Gossypium hirsutum]|uniref:Uncharacterized protein isoform X2 n=1 Tax=Gossypium hirsutum TaxID=3635 RepID=A0ABM2YTQ7_GOSHI|nr:uncharacterized protein LOC107944716 isoform X2 [Gossypium hirsutum]